MPIRTKFLIAFSLIVAPLILLATIAILTTLNTADRASGVQARTQTVAVLFELEAALSKFIQEHLSLSAAIHVFPETDSTGSVSEFAEEELEELEEANEEITTFLAAFAELHTAANGAPEVIENLTSAYEGLRQQGALLLETAENEDGAAYSQALVALEPFEDAVEAALDDALVPQLAAQNELTGVMSQNAAVSMVAAPLIFLIVISIIFIVGMRFTRSVVLPARQLQNAAEALQTGNYAYRSPDLGRDELGKVAETFNQMAEAVQERDRSLTDINTNLEKRVEERTFEVRRALALVEESSRLKSQFLANMSHELRTPLNAIIGFTGIMMAGMAGEVDDDARHMISRVQANSERLLGLIDSVLDLAKIEAGRIEIMYAPMSPRTLAERWQSETEVLAQAKNLTLDLSVDPALPEMLMGDDDRLTQIAVNLLSNAIKFTDLGGVKLSVGKSGDTWTISVSDTGVGIPPHALNYIFDEFRQVDGSTMRMYGGTGLGFSIARRLTLMMNGTIRVTSDLGKGSTFTVSLPLKLVTASQSEPIVA